MNYSKSKLLALAVIFVWGLPMIILSISSTLNRAVIEVKGTVIGSSIRCLDPSNNTRCDVYYMIEPKDGGMPFQYVSGYADSSIAQRMSLPNGTKIEKIKWAISYSINGIEINDFPIIFNIIILCFGIVIIFLGFLAFRRSN